MGIMDGVTQLCWAWAVPVHNQPLPHTKSKSPVEVCIYIYIINNIYIYNKSNIYIYIYYIILYYIILYYIIYTHYDLRVLSVSLSFFENGHMRPGHMGKNTSKHFEQILLKNREPLICSFGQHVPALHGYHGWCHPAALGLGRTYA